MVLLLFPWMLLTMSLWTYGLGQILLQEKVHVLYPKLLSDEVITCNCANMSCDWVFWFRSTFSNSRTEFIGKGNYAHRFSYENNTTHFKMSIRGTSTFVLRIIGVTEEDRGVYSCVLKDKGSTEVWKPGTLLLPGVSPPTEKPNTTLQSSVKPDCLCMEKKPSQVRCSRLVVWPLVGLLASLAVVLLCLLYYFSRLPKKCRHHLMKK